MIVFDDRKLEDMSKLERAEHELRDSCRLISDMVEEVLTAEYYERLGSHRDDYNVHDSRARLLKQLEYRKDDFSKMIKLLKESGVQ